MAVWKQSGSNFKPKTNILPDHLSHGEDLLLLRERQERGVERQRRKMKWQDDDRHLPLISTSQPCQHLLGAQGLSHKRSSSCSQGWHQQGSSTQPKQPLGTLDVRGCLVHVQSGIWAQLHWGPAVWPSVVGTRVTCQCRAAGVIPF